MTCKGNLVGIYDFSLYVWFIKKRRSSWIEERGQPGGERFPIEIATAAIVCELGKTRERGIKYC
jgi:hypothetical protein